jgi:hypothetical protein
MDKFQMMDKLFGVSYPKGFLVAAIIELKMLSPLPGHYVMRDLRMFDYLRAKKFSPITKYF